MQGGFVSPFPLLFSSCSHLRPIVPLTDWLIALASFMQGRLPSKHAWGINGNRVNRQCMSCALCCTIYSNNSSHSRNHTIIELASNCSLLTLSTHALEILKNNDAAAVSCRRPQGRSLNSPSHFIVRKMSVGGCSGKPEDLLTRSALSPS